MQQPDYEYTGQIAANWDLLRGDTSNWDDRFFYKEIIKKSGQPVLDVGCGTGRLLLDFLADGVDADGVDSSPEMLALCSEKAQKLGLEPTVYLQTMETLDLPHKYRTIIVPSSSFQLVISLDDAAEAMRQFFNHLEPGGTLVMPFMILWAIQPTDEQWHPSGEKIRPEDGAIVRRASRSTFDMANQLESTEDRYEVVRDGQVSTSEHYSRSPATRWYTQEQAADLYKKAGFTDIRLIDGFSLDHQPASKECTVFTVLGTRPQ